MQRSILAASLLTIATLARCAHADDGFATHEMAVRGSLFLSDGANSIYQEPFNSPLVYQSVYPKQIYADSRHPGTVITLAKGTRVQSLKTEMLLGEGPGPRTFAHYVVVVNGPRKGTRGWCADSVLIDAPIGMDAPKIPDTPEPAPETELKVKHQEKSTPKRSSPAEGDKPKLPLPDVPGEASGLEDGNVEDDGFFKAPEPKYQGNIAVLARQIMIARFWLHKEKERGNALTYPARLKQIREGLAKWVGARVVVPATVEEITEAGVQVTSQLQQVPAPAPYDNGCLHADGTVRFAFSSEGVSQPTIPIGPRVSEKFAMTLVKGSVIPIEGVITDQLLEEIDMDGYCGSFTLDLANARVIEQAPAEAPVSGHGPYRNQRRAR